MCNFFSTGQLKGWSEAIWPESSLPTFKLIANLGLIFFMFFLGLELDLDQIKRSWKITIPVAAASIILPGNYYYLNSIIDIEYTMKMIFSFSGYWLCSSCVAL